MPPGRGPYIMQREGWERTNSSYMFVYVNFRAAAQLVFVANLVLSEKQDKNTHHFPLIFKAEKRPLAHITFILLFTFS